MRKPQKPPKANNPTSLAGTNTRKGVRLTRIARTGQRKFKMERL
jgi:hypothetical protein